MTHREYEEKRYCVEVLYAHEYDSSTLTYRYYYDSFFEAVSRAQASVETGPKPDDLNIFDWAAGRTLFELADLS